MDVLHSCFGAEAMEGMASLYGFQESMDDLKQRLFHTTLELESARANAREDINKLKNLLKFTIQERDEAKDQLQMILNKLAFPSHVESFPVFTNLQPQGSPLMATRGNSSITESESVSETLNHQSYVSSPVESFFETVSSPDVLLNMNMADSSDIGLTQQPLLCDTNGFISQGPSSGMSTYDHTLAIYESLRVKRPLPKKGMLFQAVMEAGPLLQSLLVTGALPRWRNPPPLQPLQLPSMAVKSSRDPETLTQKAIVNSNYLVHGSANALHQENLLAESQQVYPSSTLNFSDMASFGMRKRPILSSCGSSHFSPPGKWQKTQF